jgi:hypothetical protein
MRLSGSNSWQFGHGDMGYLQSALFVRDAARLPVATRSDVPPRLAGYVPDCSDVLGPGDRLSVGEQWLAWWHRLVGQAVGEGQRSATRPPAGYEDEFEALIRHRFGGRADVFDPPAFGSLADHQPLQSVVITMFRLEREWLRTRPADSGDRQQFAWAVVRDAAESTAAELGLPVGDLTGYAHVLDVEGKWSHLAGPGCALCSAELASDPVAASRLLCEIFRSGPGREAAVVR